MIRVRRSVVGAFDPPCLDYSHFDIQRKSLKLRIRELEVYRVSRNVEFRCKEMASDCLKSYKLKRYRVSFSRQLKSFDRCDSEEKRRRIEGNRAERRWVEAREGRNGEEPATERGRRDDCT